MLVGSVSRSAWLASRLAHQGHAWSCFERGGGGGEEGGGCRLLKFIFYLEEKT